MYQSSDTYYSTITAFNSRHWPLIFLCCFDVICVLDVYENKKINTNINALTTVKF